MHILTLFNKLKGLRFENIYDHFFIGSFTANSIIVDIGAGSGAFSKTFIKNFKFSKLILVEANPALIEELRSSFKDNKSIEIINMPIAGEQKNNIPFYLNKNPEASSLDKTSTKSSDIIKEIRVNTITLKSLISLYNLKRINLLKIDVEGAECDIFEKFTSEDFKKIDQITVEFHDFLNQSQKPRVKKCIDKLKKLGYTFFSDGTTLGYGSKYYNCIFYKNTLKSNLTIYSNLFFKILYKICHKILKTLHIYKNT